MKTILVYVGFAFSAILLWLIVRRVDLAQTVEIVLKVDRSYLILSIFCFLLTICFRAVRWRYLIAVEPPIPLGALLSATSIGLMINNILPIRMGEVARACLIAKKARVSPVTALATLAVERIFDVLCLLAILGFYLRVARGMPVERVGLRIGLFGVLFLVLLVGGIVTIYCASLRQRWVEGILNRTLGKRFPGISRQMFGVFFKAIDGFTGLRGWPQLLPVLFFTVCLWLAGVSSYYFLMRAFSFPLGFSSALLVLVIVAFGVAVPSAPGYAGTFHAACILGLSLVGLQNQTLAASYAFTLHATEWASATALGLFFFWREGLSLKTIREQTEERQVIQPNVSLPV